MRGLRVARPRSIWDGLVPVVALGAGLLFATSASVSRGTDLRSSGNNGIIGLVRTAQNQVSVEEGTLRALDGRIKAATDTAADSDSQIAAIRARASGLRSSAGLTALAGPGLTVTLDDAHDSVPAGVDPNETVVHQSDLQAVVNALWVGGAEAMSIAGQRVIATSAVRCVGNTLLLNGRVYSPPFPIVAIGPGDLMRAALDRSRGVALYRQAADALGLTYRVQSAAPLRVPAYDTTVLVTTARPR